MVQASIVRSVALAALLALACSHPPKTATLPTFSSVREHHQSVGLRYPIHDDLPQGSTPSAAFLLGFVRDQWPGAEAVQLAGITALARGIAASISIYGSGTVPDPAKAGCQVPDSHYRELCLTLGTPWKVERHEHYWVVEAIPVFNVEGNPPELVGWEEIYGGDF